MPRSRVTLALIALISPRDRRVASHPLVLPIRAGAGALLKSTACPKQQLP